MKPSQPILSLSFMTLIGMFVSPASADRYRAHNIKYDLVTQYSQELEYVADELRDSFRLQFRHSPVYGKLASRSSKLRNRARRLYRYGTSRGSCDWNQEIYELNELIGELCNYVDQVKYGSRHGHSIRGSAIRTAQRLLTKAEYQVQGLKRAIVQVSKPVYKQPVYQPPVYRTPAPAYKPTASDFGRRSSYNKYGSSVHRNAGLQKSGFGHGSKHYSGHRSSGIAFNVAGVKVRLNP